MPLTYSLLYQSITLCRGGSDERTCVSYEASPDTLPAFSLLSKLTTTEHKQIATKERETKRIVRPTCLVTSPLLEPLAESTSLQEGAIAGE